MILNYLNILCLILFTTLFSSCSTFRKVESNPNKIKITESNLNKLNGSYLNRSKANSDTLFADLYWNLFNRGIKLTDPKDYITFKVISNHKINIQCYNNETIVRSKIFHGKIIEGYFEFRRRYWNIPLIFANLFRNTKFRIGILENGNIITDYRHSSFGSFFVILPDWKFYTQHNIEFIKIDAVQENFINKNIR